MSIPNFTDTLGGSLGFGISIVQDGDVFKDDKAGENIENPSITEMNAELAAATKKDDIIFLASDQQKEDVSLKFFLQSEQKKEGAQ